MNGRLIIDGNAFYEIDEECLKRQREKEKEEKQKGASYVPDKKRRMK